MNQFQLPYFSIELIPAPHDTNGVSLSESSPDPCEPLYK